jgi:hypothetical protein
VQSEKCGETRLIFIKLYSRMLRASCRFCHRRFLSSAWVGLYASSWAWQNAWSDYYRCCAGRCIGDEARVLPTFAYCSHARCERALTLFFVRLTKGGRFRLRAAESRRQTVSQLQH